MFVYEIILQYSVNSSIDKKYLSQLHHDFISELSLSYIHLHLHIMFVFYFLQLMNDDKSVGLQGFENFCPKGSKNVLLPIVKTVVIINV